MKTLAHELAHVLLHTSEDDGVAQCRGVMEVEAESVAHLVMAVHHLDSGAYTFPYVATWAHPLAAVEHVPMAEIVARTGERVMKAASEIIAATQAALEPTGEPAMEALSRRAAAAASRTAEMREQASAAALPPVDRWTLLGVTADSHSFFRRHLPEAVGACLPRRSAARRRGRLPPTRVRAQAVDRTDRPSPRPRIHG